MEQVGKALSDPTCTVTELDVSGNEQIGDDGVVALLPALPRLRSLKLQSTGMSYTGAALLAMAVAGHGSGLTHLDLGGNAIGNEGVRALALASQAGGGPGDLGVSNCGLTDESTHHLASALSACRLVRLEAVENEFTDAGRARIFGAALRCGAVVVL